MNNDQKQFFLKEYEKLKDEQHKRIEFRDHMIYLSLGGIGTVFSFAMDKPQYDISLLILPFLCIVLGWTYLNNDRKITAISTYLKKIAIPRILGNELSVTSEFENWEIFLKTEKDRGRRKYLQLVVDLSIFCLSAIISITLFCFIHSNLELYHVLIVSIETIALFYLGLIFYKNAEIKPI